VTNARYYPASAWAISNTSASSCDVGERQRSDRGCTEHRDD
jgi:hypothetical protein